MTAKSKKRDWIATAHTLSEALPFLQRYDGAVIVIKFGGHAMGDDAAMTSFARDIVLMKQCNVHPVIVHGGGPAINQMLERLDIPSSFVRGKRVTDAATMEVVEMVLAGTINKRIAQAINREGGKAVGLTGKDADLIMCDPADPELGLVGRPATINPGVIETFINSDLVPVVAPIGSGPDGETYNINGDTAAGAIAGALNADRLLLLTDVEGIKDRSGTVLTEADVAKVKEMLADGSIAGGMIPKAETALDALADGVTAVVILDGRAPHAVLLELFTEHGAGTLIQA